MNYFESFLLACALFSLSGVTSPILEVGNATLSLENRATPTTVTADILSRMRLFAQYAAAAYCNAAPGRVGTRVTCSDSACSSLSTGVVTNYAFLGFDQSQASGFIGIDPANKRIVIAFGGSSNFDNYIADLLIPMENCYDYGTGTLVSGCKLHTGFQYAWGDVQNPTMKGLKAAIAANPSYTVTVTGHSLGGAVATIAGAYIRAAGIPCDIYSYGSPRVGNTAFVNFVNSQVGAHYRVTHTDDPIPRYPGKLFGYRHTSPEFWLRTGSATTINYGITDIQVCTGISNTDCNDGTGSLSLSPHGYYFQKISSCK